VVGSGAAGLAATYTLCKYEGDVEVDLIESEGRIGGHAWTVSTRGMNSASPQSASVASDGAPSQGEELVDVGFMVMNRVTYPNMLRVFSEIGVEVEPSDMSLSVTSSSGSSWSFQSSTEWLKRNATQPRLLRFIRSHGAFAAKARAWLLDSERFEHASVGKFCEGLDADFCDNWLLPFVSAVWSVGMRATRDFSALPLLRFMDNHRFLGLSTMPWYTPKGRSTEYVNAIMRYCGDRVRTRLNTKVTHVDSEAKKLTLSDGSVLEYDAVIFACNAPAQAALNLPSKEWLKRFSVSRSRVIAHRTPMGMPEDKGDWSAWNVKAGPTDGAAGGTGGNKTEGQDGGAAVTYWLSRIQNLKDPSIFVTVNPSTIPEDTFFDAYMEHPIMDGESHRAQMEEHLHQGKGGVYHAGAWLRHGFHEDAFFTGILAARRALGRDDVPVEYPTGMAGVIEKQPSKGFTTHTRYGPGDSKRVFSYPLHMYRWDTRFPPKEFCRVDFFGDTNVPLDTIVRAALRDRIGLWPLGRIEVVANVRFLGFSFNPIVPYYAHDEEGRLVAVLCEVHNTPWKERTLYAMRVLPDGSLLPVEQGKNMHVSPFHPPVDPATSADASGAKWSYRFKVQGKHLLEVDARKDGQPAFVATMEFPTDAASAHHTNPMGSWMALYWVYVEAAKMFADSKKRYAFYDYATERLPFLDPRVASWAAFLLPATKAWLTSLTSESKGMACAAVWMLGSALALIMYGMSNGANILALLVAVVFGVMYVLFAVVSSIASASSGLSLAPIALSACTLVASLNYLPAPQTKDAEMFNHCVVKSNAAVLLTSLVAPASLLAPVLAGLITASLAVPAVGELLWDLSFDHREAAAWRLSELLVSVVTKGDVKLLRNTPSGATTSDAPNSPSIAIIVHRPIPFFLGLLGGDLGVGESYVNEDWSAFVFPQSSDGASTSSSPNEGGMGEHEVLYRVLDVFARHYSSVPLIEAARLLAPSFWLRRVDFLKHFGSLDRKSSAESIHSHYDDGNELFKAFLDDKMVYTCALFDKSRGATPEDLALAQTKKIDRILELASIPPGGKVLDIGSGWGGLVGRALSQGYAAQGLCNAANMVSYAKARYGADHFDMLDYRDIPATYDKDAVTSVEMIEAVPCRDYPCFVDACDRALRPGGRVSMQVIHAYAFNNPVATERDPVPLGTFVTTHIFPGQQLPNLEFLHEAFLKNGRFRKVYSEECGMDYARTLLMWGANLERSVQPNMANGGAPALKIPRRTLLKYRYYLAWCRAGFSNELLDLARIVFEKKLD
jgi:predicted NAD/FAD-binding protein/cyclopropane fatty-acyl-phospholipid synthase-like methyltransferase/DUF1365 family protein